jgi:TonB family protein
MILLVFAVIAAGTTTVIGQRRLTYPELSTALQVRLPNQSFQNKTELIDWLIGQIKTRKVDKPLTRDREDDLRQAGASDELIFTIKANSPAAPKEAETVVNLGDLMTRQVELVKPEYTNEAIQAGTAGSVRLELTLDEQGRVMSVKTLAGLPNGLTEKAIAAAKNSTFTPASDNGRPVKGVGTINYNFKLNKIDAAAVIATADDYRKRMNCSAAVTEYTKVIDIDARQVKALMGRGTCYVMIGKYDLAIADLNSAIKAAPSDDQAHFYRALAYDYSGDPRSADQDYDQAVKLNAELGKWPLMQCAFVDRKQPNKNEMKRYGEEIIDACNASLQSAPDFLSALIYLKRGIGYRVKSDFERSIADLESARRLNPRFPSVQTQLQISYNARGLAYFDDKEYDKAIQDVTAAINLNPQNPTPYINRCAFYVYGAKNFDQAISDCTAAIRLTDRSSMAYNHRGVAYELKKNMSAAIADYKKALQIDPKNQVALENLSRAQKPSIKN